MIEVDLIEKGHYKMSLVDWFRRVKTMGNYTGKLILSMDKVWTAHKKMKHQLHGQAVLRT
jgi:hypothetical protein